MVKKTTIARALFSAVLILGTTAALHADDAEISAKINDTTGIAINDLESKVLSTLFTGGSAPVSFSGEGRLKIQHNEFNQYPSFMSYDKDWTTANPEGNESMLRLGMVVRANRSTVLWSKIGFQGTFPGLYTNTWANSDARAVGDTGYAQLQTVHDKMDVTANIHEDMSAGMAIRTVPASFWLSMGNVQWIQASPFTIWKAQPRNTVWDFLPYEVEQPVSRYYDYNIVKGEKEGRASWHKKSFDGLNLESINLPFDLYFNAAYGAFDYYDNFEREYVDFSNDLAYAGLSTVAKSTGIGDSYRHMYLFRVAKPKLFGDVTGGLNFSGINYSNSIFDDNQFRKVFGAYGPGQKITDNSSTKMFYKEPKTLSFDVQGTIGNHLEIQGDIAANIIDSSIAVVDSSGTHYSNTTSPIAPALFGHVKSTSGVPLSADIAFVGKGFYSPFSFAAPVDAFYPFGANLLGAGKFIGRAEASPYVQNMAGVDLNCMPNIGYGHLKFDYGQHFQVDAARDLLFFPYRLNGQDLFSVFQSSYNRWGNDLVDVSLPAKYNKRLGDESYHELGAYGNPVGPDGGGLRSDYLSMFEGFVPYESVAEADSNLNEKTTIYSRSKFVPEHRKYTFNFATDFSYDISGLIGYHRDLFLSGYLALNDISTSFVPIAFDQKDQLLWSWYFRFEPAIAITDKLYILGIAGWENWRSDKAYMLAPNSTNSAVLCPINYLDYAAGLGFDWEMSARVGLHTRAKWMRHEDINYTDNNWQTPILSMEVKMYF
ncbi:MAG: hypothetical protein WBM07_16285 [Chitinivibrionales bacterium]